jgi:RNA polymerase sporulation-specific sigma factor
MTMRTEQEVERIVHENTGLVGALVSRTLRLFPRLPSGYDREDLHSLGYLGLLRAAQTYDPGRGVAFSTYAYRCIEYAITGALKRESDRQIECISLSLLLNDEEDNPLEDQIADKCADASASALNQCDRDMLESAMEGLPEQQARVIRAIYFEGDPIPQVAQRWGISSQAVQNLHMRALKAMKLRLRRLGIRRPEG